MYHLAMWVGRWEHAHVWCKCVCGQKPTSTRYLSQFSRWALIWPGQQAPIAPPLIPPALDYRQSLCASGDRTLVTMLCGRSFTDRVTAPALQRAIKKQTWSWSSQMISIRDELKLRDGLRITRVTSKWNIVYKYQHWTK